MNETIEWVIAGRLARACRPGRWDDRELPVAVEDWIAKARRMRVRSILCLLTDDELERYYHSQAVDLISRYRDAGFQVWRVPVPDHEEPPLTADELRHVRAALSQLPAPCLVHCSAGIDRTGAVVRAFLQSEQNTDESQTT